MGFSIQVLLPDYLGSRFASEEQADVAERVVALGRRVASANFDITMGSWIPIPIADERKLRAAQPTANSRSEKYRTLAKR